MGAQKNTKKGQLNEPSFADYVDHAEGMRIWRSLPSGEEGKHANGPLKKRDAKKR